jgi:hypothetical protein
MGVRVQVGGKGRVTTTVEILVKQDEENLLTGCKSILLKSYFH